MIFRIGAAFCAVSLLTLPALAATAPKPSKPVAAKASLKPTAATVYRLPAGGKPAAVPSPPASLTSASGQPAAKTPASPKPAAAVSKSKPKAKVAKKAGKKKTKLASAKAKKVKQGRAALTAMEKIDQRQLATDHLSGAERKSTLDLLISYKETLNEGDLETAGVLLRLIVNETPSREVATAVNDLIGAPLNTQDTEVLIEIARADRANAVAGQTAKMGADEKVASPLGERIHAAHAAVEAAPRTSRIDALAAYKHAVTEGNSEAAAVALSGVVQGPVDDEAIATANALLEIENILGRQASVN